MIDFSTTKALTFDCYGTLIDWERGIGAALAAYAVRRRAAVPPLEEFLAAFARRETALQSEHPGWRYSRVLERLFADLCGELAMVCSGEDARAFAASIADWPAFPDTPAALRLLQRRFLIVPVSNVDRASFAASERHLGVRVDLLITAEDVGAYKPDLRMFDAALARLAERGVAKPEIVHVAQSLFHDHAPAQRIGLRSVWVDRRAGKSGTGATPSSDARFDLRVESLLELARIVG